MYYKFILAVQTSLPNGNQTNQNELFFLSEIVLCNKYLNCLLLEKNTIKNKVKSMGKAKKGKLMWFLEK